MRTTFKLIALIIGVFSISSCAFHNGYINNSVSLNQVNFKYTEFSISGTSSTLKIFGIGGLNKYAIVEEAKVEMLKSHPLKPNQALANITLNWKSEFYFMVIINHCTMTADIVEFNDSSPISKKKLELTQKVKYKDEVQNEQKGDLSEKAKRINLIKNSSNVTETNYKSISEVKTGDVVKFKSSYGATIYSIVTGTINPKKIEVIYYPGSNYESELSYILKYTEVIKVEINE